MQEEVYSVKKKKKLVEKVRKSGLVVWIVDSS